MEKFLFNHSRVTQFIFLGITSKPELKLPLFILFLIVYIITVVANLAIIFIIRFDVRLHTPMYFFLSNLAFADISYSSAITPKMLVDILMEKKIIGIFGCAVQMFFVVLGGSSECLLLAVMAFDRYVAICRPLNYPIIMSEKWCSWLVAVSYVLSICYSVFYNVCVFSLHFCGPNVIDHFFCDIPPLLKLSCSDTHIHQIVIFVQVSINCISTTLIILISYACILSTLLRIHSNTSKSKAFSTCSSHLIVVSLFYGAIFFMYLRPSSTYTLQEDKVASLFYTVVIPMLNPLIYSLRNKDIKEAFQKILGKLL
ncbi:olfactory receptor 5AR1-like [Erythrolamprus reginae]|uniref:olfactory receptor 5AR1-like n=1 Tax=Erythrolamprus reginae TaxID=121349 RepID=UPI00396C8FBF